VTFRGTSPGPELLEYRGDDAGEEWHPAPNPDSLRHLHGPSLQSASVSKTVVLIEDETDIQEIVAYNLRQEGFRVECHEDGAAGMAALEESGPDLLLLDLMLPGMDGLEICRRIRGDDKNRELPIIMVTAKGEESDVVLGLGLGADDYIVKPFKPRELVARVKAVLRRGHAPARAAKKERLDLPGLTIDVGRHVVRVDGERTEFTATEFRLLFFLASNPGRVFTRDQLMDEVIGDRAIVIDRNIDVHVRSIRKKLGARREMIETVRGVGYRFADAPA